MTTENSGSNLSQQSTKEISGFGKQFKTIILLAVLPCIFLSSLLVETWVDVKLARKHDQEMMIQNEFLLKEIRRFEAQRADPIISSEPKDPPRQGKSTGQGRGEIWKMLNPIDPPPPEKHTGQYRSKSNAYPIEGKNEGGGGETSGATTGVIHRIPQPERSGPPADYGVEQPPKKPPIDLNAANRYIQTHLPNPHAADELVNQAREAKRAHEIQTEKDRQEQATKSIK